MESYFDSCECIQVIPNSGLINKPSYECNKHKTVQALRQH